MAYSELSFELTIVGRIPNSMKSGFFGLTDLENENIF